MPEVTRRTFLKACAFTAGAAATVYSMGKFMPLLDTKPEAVPSPPDEPPLLEGEDYFPTTCWVGKQSCGMTVRRYKGRLLKLEGHIMHPRNAGKLCPKGQAQLLGFYDPYRLKAPLVRTNDKGVPGRFREASWDEAIALVGDKVREARAADPRRVVFQRGRTGQESAFDGAFAAASGATLLTVGALGAEAGARASEYMVGYRGVLSPDFRYCNYMINWGWNLLNEGGNQLCFITHHQEFLAARERGMKVVTLDPRIGGVGPHTDTWLPIRPGTDMAFFLALANVLVEKRYLDEDYLKNHTNAPYLVKDDGSFLRLDRMEQVVDADGSVRPRDATGVDPVLDAEGEVGGVHYRTAFAIYKEHIKQYTPAWASEVTGLPEAAIQKVAEDLGDNALLGSKLTIDPSKAKPCYAACHGDPFEGAAPPLSGEVRDYVFRPVGIMAYYVAQQEHGFNAVRAAMQVFMLLGAVDAVGGVHPDLKRGVTEGYGRWDRIELVDPPADITLQRSRFFPLAGSDMGLAAQVVNNPSAYGLGYSPDVLIVQGANPLLTTPGVDEVSKALERFAFVAVVNPWLNETADHYADVVLPSATIEQYLGPLDVSTMYTRATSMMAPPMAPLFASRGEVDIQLDLAERAGFLYGAGGLLDRLNSGLGLQTAYRLDLGAKPETRDVLSRWAKSNGIDEGMRFFEKNGLKSEPRAPEEIYVTPEDRTTDGIRHRFFGESLAIAAQVMQALGADASYTRDYTALPTWRTPTFEGSPEEYDLSLVTYSKVQFLLTNATHFVHMNELEPEQRLQMNAHAAEERGIEDGDEVWVESHNAVTDETRRVRARAQVIEGIRPDTVALSQHYGGWVHPWVRDSGPTQNSLLFGGRGYTTNTGDPSRHVRVRVYRAG